MALFYSVVKDYHPTAQILVALFQGFGLWNGGAHPVPSLSYDTRALPFCKARSNNLGMLWCMMV